MADTISGILTEYVIMQVDRIMKDKPSRKSEAMMHYGRILHAEVHLSGNERDERISTAETGLSVISGNLEIPRVALVQWCAAQYANGSIFQ